MSTGRRPMLLGVGGAHLDRRGRIAGEFVPGASNPGAMREEIGGGTFNALRSAAQRGISAAIHSVRGGDSGGEAVAAAIAAAGIADLSAVFLDRATPSYTALISRDGEPLAALADMELYEAGFPRQMRRAKLREAIFVADALLCDANLPAAALEHFCAAAKDKPIYAIAISPAKVVRLAGVLDALACVFMNRREADALLGRPSESLRACLDGLRAKGLQAAVVTGGQETVGGLDADGAFALEPSLSQSVADATGAGDALAGATVAAMLAQGQPLRRALREGVAAALLAVESAASVPRLDPEPFGAALARIPSPQPL